MNYPPAPGDLQAQQIPFEEWECDQSIADRLRRVVEMAPQSQAIKTADYSWSYQVFYQQVSRAATLILERLGPGLEPVGLLFKHDAPLVAAIYGVLNAGKIFTSIDPFYPPEYQNEILRILKTRLLVVDAENLANAQKLHRLDAVFLSLNRVKPDQLLQVLLKVLRLTFHLSFLSLQAPRENPKGLWSSHRAYLHRVWSGRQILPIFPGDRHSQVTSSSFIGAFSDSLRALLNGSTLCLMDVREDGLVFMGKWLNQESITLFHPPYLFSDISLPH